MKPLLSGYQTGLYKKHNTQQALQKMSEPSKPVCYDSQVTA